MHFCIFCKSVLPGFFDTLTKIDMRKVLKLTVFYRSGLHLTTSHYSNESIFSFLETADAKNYVYVGFSVTSSV